MPRTIVVTGGGTGIGRAVAERFAHEGDEVVITGRRGGVLSQTADELGPNVRAITCDHSDPTQLEALTRHLDTVDVLVNNAGSNTDVYSDFDEDLAGTARAWQANLNANLISAVLTTQALRDKLSRPGALVHIGSIAADKGNGSYGAAKAALASWNVGLARELGPLGITSNVVAPGYIAETEFFADLLTEERRGALVAQTMLGRGGAPDDIAGAVWFLASADSRYLTGEVLNVNGGAWSHR